MINVNSNTFLKWFAAGFFIIICAVLYWMTGSDPLTSIEKQNPNVKIYTDAEIPPGGSSAIPKVDSATDTIADSTDSSSAKTSIGSASSANSGKTESVLLCIINDVLGEPVEGGTLQLGAQTIPFKQGRAQCKELPSEPFQITANANGYLSTTQTVSNRETSTVVFVMDYTCAFEMQVYSDGNGLPESHGSPQAGAEVTLYRSMLCQRPLQPVQRALIDGYSLNLYSLFDFQYKNQFIQILKADPLNAVNQFSEESSELSYSSPQSGDRVISIASCQKNLGLIENIHETLKNSKNGLLENLIRDVVPVNSPNSIHARMMDTLHLSQKKRDDQRERVEILFSRADRKFSSKSLYIPCYPGTGEIAGRAVTDNNGRCRFENLSPGLYFAEARYQNQCSMIRPLLPVSGGVPLELNSKCLLTVFTQKGGISPEYSNSMPSKYVGDVKLKLTAKDSNASGLFMANTDQRGRGQIKSIPYGTYNLTAAPPENSNFPPVQQEITINRPEQKIFLNFDQWKQHSIEGTVVYFDTLKPIPDVRLELYEILHGEFPGAVAKTDENGAFAFRDIPEGTYQLRYIPAPNEEQRICPYEKEQNIPTDYDQLLGGECKLQTIFVKDEPLYTTQIKMVSTIATRFSGWVTDSQHNPISGAEIRLFYNSSRFDYSDPEPETPRKLTEQEIPLPQSVVLSDEKGLFDFTIWTRNISSRKGDKYTGKIKTKVFSPEPKQSSQPNRISSMLPIPFRANGRPAKLTGSLALEFAFGDTLENLHVIADNRDLIPLEGRIRTVDGRIPSDLKIAIQYINMSDSSSISGEYTPDGEFIISGVENKGFRMNIENALCLNPAGEPELTEYLDERIFFSAEQVKALFEEVKSGRKPKLEFTLKESGFLQGVVQEPNRRSLAGARVHVKPGDWGTKNWTYTDKDGKFRIGQLKKDQKYPLYVTKSRGENGLQLLSPIQPNVSNIILVYKEEQQPEN